MQRWLSRIAVSKPTGPPPTMTGLELSTECGADAVSSGSVTVAVMRIVAREGSEVGVFPEENCLRPRWVNELLALLKRRVETLTGPCDRVVERGVAK